MSANNTIRRIGEFVPPSNGPLMTKAVMTARRGPRRTRLSVMPFCTALRRRQRLNRPMSMPKRLRCTVHRPVFTAGFPAYRFHFVVLTQEICPLRATLMLRFYINLRRRVTRISRSVIFFRSVFRLIPKRSAHFAWFPPVASRLISISGPSISFKIRL